MSIRDDVRLTYEQDVSRNFIYSDQVRYVFREILQAFEAGDLIERGLKVEPQADNTDMMAKMDCIIENLREMNILLKSNINVFQNGDFGKVEIR